MTESIPTATIIQACVPLDIKVTSQVLRKIWEAYNGSWSGTPTEVRAVAELRQALEAKDEWDRKIDELDGVVEHHFSQLKPVLWKIFERASNKEDLANLREFLYECVRQISSDRIKKSVENAYAGLDAEQLENRQLQPGSDFIDTQCFRHRHCHDAEK